ncbi:MAG TPA: hypothetical protein VHE78_00435 [Gemmatimonadaceae bacterium]|nr:hypothetical protein [Gemmatimonadaceae bacterium]
MTASRLFRVTAFALMWSPSTVHAQAASGSAAAEPPAWALAGGAFAPLPRKAVAARALLARIKRIETDFANGAPQRSPGTVQPIPIEDVQAVGELLSTGSPGVQARVSRVLQSAGAPPSAVASLTQALGELATISAASASTVVVAAATHFDRLVTGAPATFLRKPPGQFLAIHVALVAMVKALR